MTRHPRLAEALLLAALVLACFVPRAFFCLQREAICSDSIAYWQIAQAMERGDWDEALDYLSLNIYPPILLALDHLGFDWTIAGAWWSVVFSSLTVLPILGLTRRMFDRRVAIVTGLLYAFHPYLLAYSPLVLRDPTHWFLFMLSLYLIWRATDEAKWPLYLAAGMALSMAVHLRSEAWLLVVPLAGWTFWRWVQDPARRRRRIAGALTCLAIIPATIVLVNLTVLANHDRWEWGCMRPVTDIGVWVKQASTPSPSTSGHVQEKKPAVKTPKAHSPATASKKQASPPKPLKMSTITSLRKIFVRMVKIITYVYGLLLLISFWFDRRELFRACELPLALVCVLLFTWLALRLVVGPIDPRYFLVFVLLILPRAARGVILLSQGITRLIQRWSSNAVRPVRVLTFLIALLCVNGLVHGWVVANFNAHYWNEQADLGRWIHETLGPGQKIMANIRMSRVLVYYADGKHVGASLAEMRRDIRYDGPAVSKAIARKRPDVVVLWKDGDLGRTRNTYETVLKRRKKLGYLVVRQDVLSPRCLGIRLLVRDDLPGFNVDALAEPDSSILTKPAEHEQSSP